VSVKVTSLANGLRVAVDVMPEVESASLGIWVACGTRHETAELNGMAHMLEHMAFKGTKTRSARAIAEEIENVGGNLNAYTGREITAYHASVLKEDVALGVEMVADILRNSVFDPDELQRERGVILQEIGQALDTPDDLIFDQFQATALPGQPLGRPVLGTADSVEAIGRDDLFAFLARHYTASNMVLSAAGRVDHDHIVELAGKHFGSVPRTPANAEVPVPLAYVGGDGREVRALEQAHLVLGCQGIGYRDPDYYATAIYSTLFGGGMSSRLFQRIREERGLVYGIHCFNAAYADGGLFGIYAGTGEDDLGELVPAVCEGIRGRGRHAERGRAGTGTQPDQGGDADGARVERRTLRAGSTTPALIHGRPIPMPRSSRASRQWISRRCAASPAGCSRASSRLPRLVPSRALEPLDKTPRGSPLHSCARTRGRQSGGVPR
jgi:predicted Zn-dependent peptidase